MTDEVTKRIRRNYISFSEFPDIILQSITDYLHPASQALLVVALTAPSSSPYWQLQSNNIQRQLSPTCKVIISHGQWKILDFETVEDTLAIELRDIDIRALLVCIDALHNLKRLKLTNCSRITGSCLQPLMGSLVLEQLDLDSITESSSDGCYLNVENTVPILVSIINDPFNSFKHLTLPSTNQWISNNASLTRFLRRYNGLLEYREFNCAGCNGSDDCSESDDCWLEQNIGNVYFPQNFTCYQCLLSFCNEPRNGNIVLYCEKCMRRYCKECVPHAACAICSSLEYDNYTCSLCVGEQETETCKHCMKEYCSSHKEVVTCKKCKLTRCGDCAGGPNYTCKYCSESICIGCNTERSPEMIYCNQCESDMCYKCIEMRGKDAYNSCRECVHCCDMAKDWLSSKDNDSDVVEQSMFR